MIIRRVGEWRKWEGLVQGAVLNARQHLEGLRSKPITPTVSVLAHNHCLGRWEDEGAEGGLSLLELEVVDQGAVLNVRQHLDDFRSQPITPTVSMCPHKQCLGR